MSTPSRTVVLPRTDPDLDGVASAIGYAEFLALGGQHVTYWLPGTPDDEAAYVLERFQCEFDSDPAARTSKPRYVLVDASSLDGLPREVHPAEVVEVIDHRLHGDPRRVFPNAALQIEPVGAAATLIAEKFHHTGAKPSDPVEAMLYGAIYSNTQCLRGSITHSRDRAAAAWLRELGRIPPDLLERQFRARELGILADVGAALARERKTYDHPSGEYAIAQLELRGASKLAGTASEELHVALRESRVRLLVNLVDIDHDTSTLLVQDVRLMHLLSESLGLVFHDRQARVSPCILRKQIVAALERQQ